jgi:hypothetical protein
MVFLTQINFNHIIYTQSRAVWKLKKILKNGLLTLTSLDFLFNLWPFETLINNAKLCKVQGIYLFHKYSIWEGDQELIKRAGRDESTWVVTQPKEQQESLCIAILN